MNIKCILHSKQQPVFIPTPFILLFKKILSTLMQVDKLIGMFAF